MNSFESLILNPEIIHQVPGYLIFAIALGWMIKRFQSIIDNYNKMIMEMSEKCRATQIEVSKEHREAIATIVEEFGVRMREISDDLKLIRDTTMRNESRIQDIHERVVVKPKK